MHRDSDGSSHSGVPVRIVLIKTFQELFRRLPVSFYLLLAIIVMLLLGVNGFRDLEDPRRLAFSLTVFLVFFGAVVYRAMIDGVDIARKHLREEGTLMKDVFERDGFAEELHERVKASEEADGVVDVPDESEGTSESRSIEG